MDVISITFKRLFLPILLTISAVNLLNQNSLVLHFWVFFKDLHNISSSSYTSDHGNKTCASAHKSSLCQQVKVFPALLIVEPLRNVSHRVHYKVCERKDIQRTLVERFLSEQDLQRGKDFFQSSHKHHDALIAQQGHFQLVWEQLRLTGHYRWSG